MLKTIRSTNYFSAFSIIEVVVSMAITAIIMGFVFVIFSIISERMLDYKNQNQLISDMNRLTYCLNKDIFENEKMAVIDNNIVFKGYTGAMVNYELQEDYILRRTTFVDTFKVKPKQIRMDSVHNVSRNIFFQKLKFKVEVNTAMMDMQFYKPIYANRLMLTLKDNEPRFK